MDIPSDTLRYDDVLRITGYRSKSTIKDKMAQGKFPQSFPLSDTDRDVGWAKDEVLAWDAERKRRRYDPEAQAARKAKFNLPGALKERKPKAERKPAPGLARGGAAEDVPGVPAGGLRAMHRWYQRKVLGPIDTRALAQINILEQEMEELIGRDYPDGGELVER